MAIYHLWQFAAVPATFPPEAVPPGAVDAATPWVRVLDCTTGELYDFAARKFGDPATLAAAAAPMDRHPVGWHLAIELPAPPEGTDLLALFSLSPDGPIHDRELLTPAGTYTSAVTQHITIVGKPR